MEPYTLLKNLNTSDGKSFIKVRVSREWEGKKSGSQFVTSKAYIIIDEEGTQVQAGLLQFGLIAEFTKRLKLGGVYMISNYNVEHAPETYRPVSGDYIVKFHRKTVVNKVDDVADIPMLKFELKTFQEARERLDDVVTLMDVVGKLTVITEIQTSASGRKSMDIVLANQRNDTIKITLWENQAYNFIKWEAEYKKPNVFIIVTATSTRSVRGEIVLWSSSSTQYFFNIEHSAIVELRENPIMKDNKKPIVEPFIKNPMQVVAPNIDIVTIEQLFDAQLPNGESAVLFYVEATVGAIIPYYGWYYIACNKCNRKLNELQECNSCNHVTKAIPKYKVTVAVQDSTSNTTFMLFDRVVMKLINVSAQHILNNDQNASPDMTPPVLNNILGKTYKFKVRLTSYNTVQKREDYTVADIEEIDTAESKTLKYDADTPKKKLNHESKEPSKSPANTKRKLLDDEKKLGDSSPPADHSTKVHSGILANTDTNSNASSGDESPPTSFGVKKKNGKQSNKRQK